MSDATLSTSNQIKHRSFSSMPGFVSMILIAAIGFIVSAFYSDNLVGILLFVASAFLATLAIIVRLSLRQNRHDAAFLEAAKSWSEHDITPTIATDLDLKILFRNPAAVEQFPRAALDLTEAIGGLFASPENAIDRLQRRAETDGLASEDIPSTRGNLRLTAQKLEKSGLIWRLEEQSAEKKINLDVTTPMMEVAANGDITRLNQPLRDLIGYRPATVEEILPNFSSEPFGNIILETPSGQKNAILAIVDVGDGRKLAYLWPDGTISADFALADSLPVPIMRMSTEGVVELANSRAKSLMAFNDVGVDFSEIVEGLGRPVSEWILEVAEGRSTWRTEVVRAVLPSQDVFLQVALGRVVIKNVVSIVAVLIDATELKTLEGQFVQSQKMQAIGQLAGGVAHDFNNLLTAISGHCDLLMLRHEPGDPDYGDLVQISQNANRAASLVGQLLAFSRKQNMQPEVIDLRETLGELTHLLNRLVGEKIDLRWSHDPDLPRIRADKRQLEQVLMNLVVNARDAMPQGGRVNVRTGSITLSEPLKRDRAELPPGEYVLVKVEDEGCGIPADKLPKIFEPFFSTKKLGEGTGLGLSMAYGIVKQSGGFIFADSVVSKGTEFSLYFPAYNTVEAEPLMTNDKKSERSCAPEGGVVLLVEDEAPVRAFASRALRLRGYTVIEADSAEAALETLENEALKIDIFVTDVVMPGLDGPTWVSQALKKRPDVKVVFVSGYAEDSVRHSRAKIPNSVFLPKPFSLSQLTETVQKQLK